MEYEGGTYISQVEAFSEKAACKKWAESLEVSEIKGLGIKGKEILIKEIESEELVPIESLQNVWCVSAFIRGKSPLIHFIKTEIPNNANPQSEIQNPKSN